MNGTTIVKSISTVTKAWAKQREAEEKRAAQRENRNARLNRVRHQSVKSAAEEFIDPAFRAASSEGTLRVEVRQIFYNARPPIQERTHKPLSDQYFIQTLLVDYMKRHPETEEWDVIFDSRGHLTEPHTDRVVPLGTLEVRDYLDKIRNPSDEDVLEALLPQTRTFPTIGPRNRYSALLFIEKEGFSPLFQQVKLAERYDIGLLSTKGMSVTACRNLIDELAADGAGIPLFVLHDFDKSGFSILGTLKRSTPRYEFRNVVEVVDFGVRLSDVKQYRLVSEDVHYKSEKADAKRRQNLALNGATPEEIDFICGDGRVGQRVELNAFNSGDFVEWIEGKLEEHGVRKVIPGVACIERAYRRALMIELLRREMAKMEKGTRAQAEAARVPRGLSKLIARRMREQPELPWDQIVAEKVLETLAEDVA